MIANKVAVVLLVEDNAEDVRITQRAFERVEPWVDLRVARDGQEALDYLMHHEKYQNGAAPRPDIVLLDYHLPKYTGLEVLQNIRANRELASIPVVMLTATERQETVDECYAAGANTFIQKPLHFEQSLRTLEVLREYWLTMARLPRAG
jgi:CheY-like chemotaxis protein